MANEMNQPRTGLAALGELSDYRVARGHPDIRGWKVMSGDGKEIGKVRDLLVDLDAHKARYMILGLKHGLFSAERHVVVPVGQARLDDRHDHVFLDTVNSSNLDVLRDYDAATFREQERTLFGGDYTGATYDDTRFWGSRRAADVSDDRHIVLHEEQLDINRRQVSAGEAVIRKEVETERVRQTVPVSHEEVRVERRPYSGDPSVSGEMIVEEQEVRIPLMAEEATVEKRVVPTEEVVITKTRVTEEQTVEEELRHERANVDESGVRREGIAGVRKKEPV